VTFGEDPAIDPTVVFKPHDGATIVLGDRVRIRRYGELCGPIVVGNVTRMNRNVYIRPNTHIGDYVRIGAFVRIVSDHHEIGTVRQRCEDRVTYPAVVIEDGVWIGTGATILGGPSGRRIGRGAIVGAGAVVTRDVPPDTIWAGNPARQLRQLEPLRDADEAVVSIVRPGMPTRHPARRR
jgi:acetyltransferase-like isoleucine patch superfamily enzyme